MERVRVDKWLWAARFFKTRTLATEAVSGGKVHINGTRAKPSKDVQVGDTIELTVAQTPWEVEVTGLADRRGSAAIAATLYTETPESAERRRVLSVQRRVAPPVGADMGERPTKRDRRRLEDLTGRRGSRGRGRGR